MVGGIIVRLDKYLKCSRIIKRRTVAKEACDQGRVILNGNIAKAGSEIKEEDIIEINFGNRKKKIRVTNINEHMRKQEAQTMYDEIQ